MEKIAAAHMLVLCESIRGLDSDRSGIVAHTLWLVTLIEMHRTEFNNNRVQECLDSNVRLFAMWELIPENVDSRKQQCRFVPSPQRVPGTIRTLAALAMIGVNLREESYRLCERQKSDRPDTALILLGRLTTLERELHTWITAHHRRQATISYWLLPAEQSPGVFEERSCSIFQYDYRFPDLEAAIIHVTSWMCILNSVRAQLYVMLTCRKELEMLTAQLDRLHGLADE